MGIPGAANPLLLASAGSSYQIERSLRFNPADSAYLSRTPASAGTSRRVMTWSLWVKRTTLSAEGYVFDSRSTASNNPHIGLRFTNGDAIECDYFDGTNYGFATTSVYRDVGAWYHVVLAVDNTQSTSSDRGKLFVNGQAINSFSSYSWTAQNTDLPMNTTAGLFTIGTYNTNAQYFSGYLADIHFIDGQALTPSSFGEFDGNGVWQPKAYTGSYGTNGFHLPFSDNSTAAALGTDTSGNGNTWTVNNLSVTAGSGNDSLVDTPTSYGTDTGIGGEVRGNYCTWNPLKISSGYSLSNGNLVATGTFSGVLGVVATTGVSTGKWYFEVFIQNNTTSNHPIGLTSNTALVTDGYAGSTSTNGWSWVTGGGGITKSSPNIAITNDTGSGATGDLLQLAIDCDAGKVWLGKNGAWTASGNPAAGTNQTITYTVNEGPYFPVTRPYNGSVNVANFGQRPFAYTAPSGFKALCTQNLPEGTITTSGTFTGNANADGPFVYLNGVPTAMTINGNAVTFGTHADKLSNGFKVRENLAAYNTSGSNTYSVTTTGSKFKYARAQPNP